MTNLLINKLLSIGADVSISLYVISSTFGWLYFGLPLIDFSSYLAIKYVPLLHQIFKIVINSVVIRPIFKSWDMPARNNVILPLGGPQNEPRRS